MSKFNTLTNLDIERKIYEVEINQHRSSPYYRASLLIGFLKLSQSQQELARYGIERHLYYCDKNGNGYDFSAILEIIQDAKRNISIAKEMQRWNDTTKHIELKASSLSFLSGFSFCKTKSKRTVLV